MRLAHRTSLLVLFGMVFFTAIYLIRIREDMVDFRVNYQAGERIRDGVTLYQTEDGHFMFKYLPFSALLYVPLSFLPLEAAKTIWYGALVGCSIALFHLSGKIASGERPGTLALHVFPPLILAKFYFREMQLGQINIIVTLVLLLMVRALISGRQRGEARGPKGPGLLWGLGAAVKPYGFIFFPYFLVKRQWGTLGAGLVVVVLALLLPSLFYGLAGNLVVLREWASTLSQSTPTLLTSNDNISIIAFFMKWTQDQDLSWILAGAVVGALAVLVLAVILAGKSVREPVALECSLLLTLIPLISPLGWDYTLLMSVLAVTIIVENYAHYSRPERLVLALNFCVIALSIYDVIGPTYYGVFMARSILTINFLVVIGLLVELRFRKLA